MSWKETWKTIFWPEWDSGGLALTRDQVAVRIFENAESPSTTGTLSAAWTGTNVTVTRETTAPLNGEGSVKVVVAGGAGSVFKAFDRAMFAYPFPGHNGIRIRYVKFRATCSAGSEALNLVFKNLAGTISKSWAFTVEQDKTVEWVVDLDPDNTESYPAPTIVGVWDPELIDRFGFSGLTSGITYYFDDIEFLYEYSLMDILGFPTEAPVDMGDVGSINAKINGLWANVKALEGRTYQYNKVGPNELEVGDEAVWALELLSDFAPPTTTEIETGAYQIDRIRHGVSTTIVPVTPPGTEVAASVLAGTIFVTYQPEEDNWTEGDILKVTFFKGTAVVGTNEYCIRTDEEPDNVLTGAVTGGVDESVEVPNAYEYQVGWQVRLYEGATTEYLTIDSLPTPTTVHFDSTIVNNFTIAAHLTRVIQTDLDTAVFFTRLTREPMIEFEGNSFFETDREDGAHTQVGDNVHWDFQNYKVGGGTQTGGISTGKINLQVVDAGDYAAKDLYSFLSKYFRIVIDVDGTFTAVGALGGAAGLALYKGTAYDANNHFEVKLYEDNVPTDVIRATLVIGGATIFTTDVSSSDDAVAFMIERNDRTWRAYYSTSKFPDYEWILINEGDDAADTWGEESSALAFVEAGNAGATVAGAFDNFKYIINSKFLEQIYDKPAVVPIFDKQADPRVDQNTATGIEIFRVGLMDINNGLPTVAEITPGTTLVDRFREGTDTDWTNQAGETITNGEVAGYIYALYDFPNATWKPGDQARMRLTGVKVTDAVTSRVYEVPDFSIYFVVGGPPNADEPQNLWLGDVIGSKADKAQPIEEDTISLLGYAKAAITRGMDALLGRCNVDMAPSTTTIVSDDLVGYGNDAFNTGYQMIVLRSTATPGVAPEMEMRDINAYASDTGTFVTEAFSATVKLNDLVLIVSNAMASMISAYGIADAASGASNVRDAARTEADNWWNGQQVMMLSGLARGQVRPIYDFTTGVDLLVSPAFDAVPAAGDVYAIIPRYTEIVPRTIDDTQNALTSQVIGRKDDTTQPKAGADKTAMGYLKAIAARGMDVLQATVTTGGSPTIVVASSLIGFGTDFFANQFYMQVIKAGAAVPEGRVRKITAYTSSTGSFTVDTFTDNVDTNDEILIIHESQLASISSDLRIGDGSGLVFSGVCSATHAAPTLNAVCVGLAGFGDDFFNTQFWIQIVKGVASPVVRKISDYDSITGTFTWVGATGIVSSGDKILIIHESLVAPTAGETADRFVSQSVGAKTDLPIPKVAADKSAISYLKGLLSRGMVAIQGICTLAVPHASVIESTDLVGYGTDFFKDYFYMQVIWSGGAALGEVRKITAYNTNGTFTCDAFSAVVTAGDQLLIIHESLVAIGRNDANNTFDSSLVTANADGSALERLEDIHDDVNDASGLAYSGVCTSAGTAFTAIVLGLAGFGDDFFNTKYFIQITYNANSHGNSPEPKVRPISDYDTITGTFTWVDTVTDATEVGDKVLIFHESLASLGRNDADNAFDSSSIVGNQNGSVLERLELAQSHGILGVFGVVSTGGAATSLAAVDLIGYGDDFFKTHFYVQVLKSALVTIGTTKKVIGYTSTTGTFTFANFGANFTAGDIFVVIHESVVAVGRDDADNEYASTNVVGNLDGSLIERLEWMQSRGMPVLLGVVTTGGSDVTLADTQLNGYGTDFFKDNYYVQALKSALIVSGTTKKITGYTSATGVFTFGSFGANWTAADLFLVLHESLVAIGRNDANNEFDSSTVVADDDGSVLEREEYIQQQLGYGVRLLTEDLSTISNKTVITSAAELPEAAGFWKNAGVLCITGDNVGQFRWVVSNIIGTSVTVGQAFAEEIDAGDTFLLISAYKPQTFEQQADTAVNLSLIQGDAATNVLSLATAGYSYELNQLVLKSADPTGGGVTAQVVTITLYELINDVSTAIDTFTIDGTNYATYFTLFDMFGQVKLTGDSLIVTAALSAGATTPIAVTGQYQHALVYTGAG